MAIGLLRVRPRLPKAVICWGLVLQWLGVTAQVILLFLFAVSMRSYVFFMLFLLDDWKPHQMVGFAAPNKVQLIKTNVEVQSHSGEMLKPPVETRVIPPTAAIGCAQQFFWAKYYSSSAGEDLLIQERCTATKTCLYCVCSVRRVGLLSIDLWNARNSRGFLFLHRLRQIPGGSV